MEARADVEEREVCDAVRLIVGVGCADSDAVCEEDDCGLIVCVVVASGLADVDTDAVVRADSVGVAVIDGLAVVTAVTVVVGVAVFVGMADEELVSVG
jgi:hypothetical protein